MGGICLVNLLKSTGQLPVGRGRTHQVNPFLYDSTRNRPVFNRGQPEPDASFKRVVLVNPNLFFSCWVRFGSEGGASWTIGSKLVRSEGDEAKKICPEFQLVRDKAELSIMKLDMICIGVARTI
ncbi:uncharacterized protein LOC110911101 [Helianthus annuus]|uniref:uncharacterized protein LOC110911101 n=1 Tax=Helianthus annuus TaxID=4232 RepID=UPI000B8FDC13|nr:uncharacterized protein LOC110911101 [Helianthus annuus]